MRSDNSTVRPSEASSMTLVVDDARRRPMVLVMVSSVSVVAPAVVISPTAKRVLLCRDASIATRHASALLIASTRRDSDSSSSREGGS
jgi:hypothetical protein